MRDDGPSKPSASVDRPGVLSERAHRRDFSLCSDGKKGEKGNKMIAGKCSLPLFLPRTITIALTGKSESHQTDTLLYRSIRYKRERDVPTASFHSLHPFHILSFRVTLLPAGVSESYRYTSFDTARKLLDGPLVLATVLPPPTRS